MPSPHAILRMACALCGLALVGCYSPYRSSPYGNYGSGIPMYNGQPMPVQPQFGPPVGSPTPVYQDGGIPNGSFPPAGSTFEPNYNGGTQFNNGGTLTPTPDPAGSFPPSNGGAFPPSNSGSFGPPASNGFDPSLPPPTGGGLVPNYGDPENLPPAGGGNTFEGNTTPFQSDGASFQRDSSSQSLGSLQYTPGTQVAGVQLAAHQTSRVETIPVVTPANNPVANPYGYDADGYRWIRGIVDFDEQQQAWVLIYDASPDPQDAYKGQITLVQNDALRSLKNNSLVVVEGRIDNTSRDPGTGKPQYRVSQLQGS